MTDEKVPELPRSLVIAAMCGGGMKYEIACELFDNIVTDQLRTYGDSRERLGREKEAAEWAKGVKVRIPTETMEQEIAVHARRAREKALEDAANIAENCAIGTVEGRAIAAVIRRLKA